MIYQPLIFDQKLCQSKVKQRSKSFETEFKQATGRELVVSVLILGFFWRRRDKKVFHDCGYSSRLKMVSKSNFNGAIMKEPAALMSGIVSTKGPLDVFRL